jgi:benzoate-CoA ligase family protein
MDEAHETAPTRPDDIAFWLYTSGTTGRPKGVMHFQTDLAATVRTYAESILRVRPGDRMFSAGKLFFAYGLGNSLTFPFAAGAAAVLLDERPTPESVRAVTVRHRPTMFFGVPTLYAMMLNSGVLPELEGLRICASAGEALPERIFERWKKTTGLEILDGIGSTEMLHIFLSNAPGAVKPGTSGRPVDGYHAEVRDDQGRVLGPGEMGDLFVSGPSSAAGYWNMREASQRAFRGRWVHTGDKYVRDEQGYFTHCGRSDDLLKVGGIYVSPGEVENALLGHEAVAEVAVVGARDADDLVKPKAFVVTSEGHEPSAELASVLIAHCRQGLADYKRPRWIEFIPQLPKTATGKIQRFRLRD